MITVHIPALMRDLTGDIPEVRLALAPERPQTVLEVLRALDQRFPGFMERLLYREDLLPGVAVFINGEQGLMKLQEKVGVDSEVHFLPPVVGG